MDPARASIVVGGILMLISPQLHLKQSIEGKQSGHGGPSARGNGIWVPAHHVMGRGGPPDPVRKW